MSHPAEHPIQHYALMSRDDLSGYWFNAYGWIACYFAQLEGLSYALIEAFAPSEAIPSLMRMPYQARTDQAERLVCAHLRARGDSELAEEWSRFLAEAKAAAPMRNDVLHNPLSISLALGNPLHDTNAGIVLTHEADRRVLKLGTVQAFSKTMLDLNLVMQGLLRRSGLAAEPKPTK